MITAQRVHEAFNTATPDAIHKDWSEVGDAAKARYEVMSTRLNEHAMQEIQERVKRHIASLDSAIEEQRARIRETYDSGVHTNVDPQRAAIERYEQRKLAFEIVLDEIS